MKYALVPLLMAFGGVAFAQPIHQCKDSFGNNAFQGRPCAEPLQVADNTAYVGFFDDSNRRPHAVSHDPPKRPASGWNYQMRKRWRHYARYETQAVSKRVEIFQKPFKDQQQAQYAANLRRCQNVMQVDTLCGRPEGMFTCGEKGFVARPVTEASTLKPRSRSNAETYAFDRCVLHASKGKT